VNSGSDNDTTRSVLQAPNTVQAILTVVVVVHELVVVAHVPVVGEVAKVLRGTPPVAVVADIAEIATRTAEAARQGGKAILVITIAATVPTTFCL